MFRSIVKIVLFVLVIRAGYTHRYRLMNIILLIPFVRRMMVNWSRGSEHLPVGLITRVYL
ncbi:MAG: hypothetical protein ACI4XS_10970 [Bacillus sp. (in: firmicutes)]